MTRFEIERVYEEDYTCAPLSGEVVLSDAIVRAIKNAQAILEMYPKFSCIVIDTGKTVEYDHLIDDENENYNESCSEWMDLLEGDTAINVYENGAYLVLEDESHNMCAEYSLVELEDNPADNNAVVDSVERVFTIEKVMLESGKSSMLPTGYSRKGRTAFQFLSGIEDSHKPIKDVSEIVLGLQVAIHNGLNDYMNTSPVAEIIARDTNSVVFRTQTSVYKLTQQEE